MRIGYVRVSDFDQTENLQIDALKKAGCDVIYGDHGVSGAVVHRKGLEEVLNRLDKGDTLVVWKIDRLGRSTVNLLLLLERLHKREIGFVAVTQGIDTTTALGRLIFGQLALFAEFEREQIRERTRAGMAAAKKRGKHLGRPKKLTDRQITFAKSKILQCQETYSSMAEQLGVCRTTLYRAVKKLSSVSSTSGI